MQENSFDTRENANPHSPSLLGLDPSQPFYDLNLAGSQGVPSPQMLTQATNTHPAVILPDFRTPDYTVPILKSHDLVGPGITAIPEFTADPALPDLDAYTHPYELDFFLQWMTPDAQVAQHVPTPTEIAQSLYPGLGFSTLNVHHEVTDVDPSLPDLQHPDLTQQVHMPAEERPADLDPNALVVLYGTPSYQQTADTSYPDVRMEQHGMNASRTRHLALLHGGLDI